MWGDKGWRSARCARVRRGRLRRISTWMVRAAVAMFGLPQGLEFLSARFKAMPEQLELRTLAINSLSFLPNSSIHLFADHACWVGRPNERCFSGLYHAVVS